MLGIKKKQSAWDETNIKHVNQDYLLKAIVQLIEECVFKDSSPIGKNSSIVESIPGDIPKSYILARIFF